MSSRLLKNSDRLDFESVSEPATLEPDMATRRADERSRKTSSGLSREKSKWSEFEKEYQSNIQAIKKILSGKNKSLLRALTKEMKTLSRTRHYEEAGRVRDQIKALERIFEHKNVIKNDMPSDRQRALNALADILHLSEIKRIEGYDISNIHGNYAYGSMVVFIDGVPAKDEYRIFKIRTVAGSDDPRMMFETIARRLKHAEWTYPDVMLIDGGPTQLNAAIRAKSEFTISNFHKTHPPLPPLRKGGEMSEGPLLTKEGRWGGIKIVSLAKREEELYLSSKAFPIKIKQSSESLYTLITHIRDESHRFAISHYRKAHRKKLTG